MEDINEIVDDEPEHVKTWDPASHERQWYSNKRTGDRGWKVVRDYVDCIKYDQPNMDRCVEYREAEWSREEVPRSMMAAGLAQICHAADKALCQHAQLYQKPRPDWVNLTDAQKKRWFGEGPSHPLRARLFAFIQEALREEVG